MGLNPFKNSDLEDLQKNIKDFLKDQFGELSQKLKDKRDNYIKKGKEQITVMFIPHSAKKIFNFHIPIYAIILISTLIIVTITLTSVVIINHSSTLKEVSKLKMYGTNSKFQIKKYRDEITLRHLPIFR